jgi:hypothetical protein
LDHGVAESITDAIVSELSELESKDAVKEIMDAAAESEGVSFTNVELDMAKQLALEEWMRSRMRTSS